jgi:hypothetical protein
MVLTSVTVTRGGDAPVFDPSRLIAAQVTHFKSTGGAMLAVAPADDPPAIGGRSSLLSDLKVNTGLLNPGGAPKQLTSDPILSGPDATLGLAVRFERPVVNLAGDDVVVFELHTRRGSPIEGDAFHVSPLVFQPGLCSFTVNAFDIHLDHPKALPVAGFNLLRFNTAPGSVDDLDSLPLAKASSAPVQNFYVLAVGVDLSDLGYADGAAVEGLFFQDKDGKGLMIDPVLIAGLPAPESPNVFAKEPPTIGPTPPRQKTLQELLDGPLCEVEEIVFAVRVCGFDHWYANFGRYAAAIA